MLIRLNTGSRLNVEQEPVEIVERKGIGHPDTLCDRAAEEFSIALSQYYREHFGAILHHNTDKALLVAGRAHATFGPDTFHEMINGISSAIAWEEMAQVVFKHTTRQLAAQDRQCCTHGVRWYDCVGFRTVTDA